MSDEESLLAQYDSSIEPAIEALQNFARLHQALFRDGLSINHERFLACWIAQVLWEVGINFERAVESLADAGLTLFDDPLFEINDRRPGRSADHG
jgi:hypothetical protein